jgi:hypothetical protein
MYSMEIEASWTMGNEVFPGVKRLERGVSHPPPSSVEVSKGWELYFQIPSATS